ncbi:plasmid mobilization relaxosome protein MobC [Neisseriaceae bacterium ESL0693]|nr:plasmid mobilization relaxosome protein MobC [Neisseriaceae bacterium ESL0693]
MSTSQIKIWGLPAEAQEKLTLIAKQKVHKASISLLAKTLLMQLLETTATVPESEILTEERYRLELKLSPAMYHYLKTVAAQQYMTPNAVAVNILNSYRDQHPTLSDKEAEALYQSNYQLLRIGRNLNQIARQLNIGEATSLTAQEIRQLREIIEQHTDKVKDLLLANQQRYY